MKTTLVKDCGHRGTGTISFFPKPDGSVRVISSATWTIYVNDQVCSAEEAREAEEAARANGYA